MGQSLSNPAVDNRTSDKRTSVIIVHKKKECPSSLLVKTEHGLVSMNNDKDGWVVVTPSSRSSTWIDHDTGLTICEIDGVQLTDKQKRRYWANLFLNRLYRASLASTGVAVMFSGVAGAVSVTGGTLHSAVMMMILSGSSGAALTVIAPATALIYLGGNVGGALINHSITSPDPEFVEAVHEAQKKLERITKRAICCHKKNYTQEHKLSQ